MAVFVQDKNHKPLMPCSEKRARLLLTKKKARIHCIVPFTIRLVDRTVQNSILQPLRCKIDPGSRTTGIAIVRENKEEQTVLSLIEITHRGSAISKTLKARAAKRRRRRSNLRYRSPRFANRRKPTGWLAPSLCHRVENITNWIQRFQRLTPLTSLTCEKVRFDMQKLLNPEIKGIEYQRGTLFGYEIREYLLEKWGRQCAYCDAQNVPLQVDHIVPRSHGGSDRVSNLTLACQPCNIKKGNLSVEDFAPKRAANIYAKPSLQGAAAVTSTRTKLWEWLTSLPLPCEAGTGGQTKYNRERLGVPKTHALDAACTGVTRELKNWRMPTQQIFSTGRGAYQRTLLDRFGFPRGILTRKKRIQGFQTGDLVVAKVSSGKKRGNYAGRVAIRASGYFNIQTALGVVQGIHFKNCRIVQRSDGYNYPRLLIIPEGHNILNQTKEQRFLPPLKGWVSALSIG